MFFIPNCIDTNKFKPLSNNKTSIAEKIILVPRQITWDRGIHLAIKSFVIFIKKHNEYKLLIAGAIRSSDYKKYCDEIILKNDLSDKVIWKHDLDNKSIVKYYQTSIMTIIPSLRREGTSLSALESMASGCPVVSTNVAGLADLPSLQSNPDAISLANKMEELLQDYEKIREYQMQITRNTFNMGNWSIAWLNVIKGV